MSEHKATVSWQAGDAPFTYETYDRNHHWTLSGGLSVPASSAPGFKGDPERVDPEEALVASISSCHMLTLLAIAAKKRLNVLSYHDEAIGFLEPDDRGKLAITRVLLRPRIEFGEPKPDPAALDRLHKSAHRNCFIANSVRCAIAIDGSA